VLVADLGPAGKRSKCTPLVAAKDRISIEGRGIDVDERAPHEITASALAT
jgi:hypothetical protein